MARKFENITELYRRTQESVTSPAAWQSFLFSACRNYKLPFDEQLLVYAQRPDATAVLEIERWNKQFGRWVNKGASGIAVFDGEYAGQSRLKYYFDIADTHESRFSRAVPLWQMCDEYETDTIGALENSFGELSDKTDLTEALLSAAKNAVEDNMADYLSELRSCKENSFLEELDDLNVEVIYKTALQNSIAYMLLARCGIDTAEYFTDDDFREILNFNTPETLNALGTATGDISQMCLLEISRTVMSLQKPNRQTNLSAQDIENIDIEHAKRDLPAGAARRTIADVWQNEYDILESNFERSFENERIDIHDEGRLQSAEFAAATGDGSNAREVRAVSPQISQTTQESAVHKPLDLGQAERTLDGNGADSIISDRADNSADSKSRGRDGEFESARPNEVGRLNEQYSALGRRNSFERADIQLTGISEQITMFSHPKQNQPIFTAAEDYIPQRRFFVSNDEPVITEELPAQIEQLAPPKPKRERITFTTLHPEISAENRHDFHITDKELGYGTPSEKYSANVAAIRTLKNIEAEERLAAPDEQAVLSKYIGWGGLSDCFDERNAHYEELKNLLDEDEYATARASSLTAFYTSPVIIEAMYKALSQMGFESGNILEPSCGVGNFIGMLPQSMAHSKVYGVEIDSVSGRIAAQLYQSSSIAVVGFENVNMPDSFFDVAIGNVPFGDFKLLDRKYDKHHWLIHDYFFGKTLDKVRPSGVVALITSKGTMDKDNSSVRKYLAQRAELIGAIRLPDNAFKRNAGTEVTSDIIFLQKRDRMTDIEPDWVHLDTDQNGIKMNSYFVNHPEMVLGEMKMETTRFGMDSACKAYENGDLSALLSEAVNNLHAEITPYELEEITEEDLSIPADPSVRNFSYTVQDGKLYFRENSRMHPVNAAVTAENRIRGMITLRDCARALIEYQTENYPDEIIAQEQSKLNALYDSFVKKYDRIFTRGNILAFCEDSSYCLLCSLEILDDEGSFARKADMFTKRTIRPHIAVTRVDTASEALAVSISEKARVDMEYMAELSGKSAEELETELSGVIFRDVQSEAADLQSVPFVTADEYLSGNVRRKLQLAKAFSPNEKLAHNISALETVQPQDLTAGEIGVRIGATWVPTDVYRQFMFELLDTGYNAKRRMNILYSKYSGEWNISEKNSDYGNIKAVATYGTKRMNAYQIFEQTLNLKDVRVFDHIEDENGSKKAVLNKKETAIAQDRQELIKSKFSEWIWKDIDRRESLCKIYNIVQGLVSTIMRAGGIGGATTTVLPDSIVTAVENCGFFESIPLWAVTLIGGLFITVLSFIMIMTVYGRFFKLYLYTAIAPVPLSTFAGEPSQNVGKSFIKSYAAVCLEGAIIVLACVIFSMFASSPPVVDVNAAAVTQVWSYVGEVIFNLLILVGAVKMSDRVAREIFGL